MPRNRILSLLREFKQILIEEKAWWIAPILLILLIAAFMISVSQSSSISPFLYALI